MSRTISALWLLAVVARGDNVRSLARALEHLAPPGPGIEAALRKVAVLLSLRLFGATIFLPAG